MLTALLHLLFNMLKVSTSDFIYCVDSIVAFTSDFIARIDSIVAFTSDFTEC